MTGSCQSRCRGSCRTGKDTSLFIQKHGVLNRPPLWPAGFLSRFLVSLICVADFALRSFGVSTLVPSFVFSGKMRFSVLALLPGVLPAAAIVLRRSCSDFGGAIPKIEMTGDNTRPYAVQGNTFMSLDLAMQRACDLQNNACFDQYHGGNTTFSPSDCGRQYRESREGRARLLYEPELTVSQRLA